MARSRAGHAVWICSLVTPSTKALACSAVITTGSFLAALGVSTSRAVRIYKQYGGAAIDTVRANPYRLAQDIPRIGFHTADQIAQKTGVPADSILRAGAGLAHVLLEATEHGHCGLPRAPLKEAAVKLLGVSDNIIEAALERALRAGDLAPDTIAGEAFIFLPALKRAEEGVAARIKQLCAAPANYPPIDFEKALAWYQQLSVYASTAGDRRLLARVPNVIGGVHLELFDLDEALRLNLEGVEVAQQWDPWPEPRAHSLVKAGLAHMYRGSTALPRRASAAPRRF